MEALGLVETKGFAGLLEAGNAMVRIDGVQLVAYEKIGGGYVSLIVRGEQEAIKRAVAEGARQAERVGELISAHVLDDPQPQLLQLMLAQGANRPAR